MQRDVVRHAHVIDSRFEQGVPVPVGVMVGDGVDIAVILGVKRDPVLERLDGKHLDLHLDIGIHTDIEDLPMAGEPGIGPAAVVADAYRRHAVDHADWLGFFGHTLPSSLASKGENRTAPSTAKYTVMWIARRTPGPPGRFLMICAHRLIAV